jgi:hypothetical protein
MVTESLLIILSTGGEQILLQRHDTGVCECLSSVERADEDGAAGSVDAIQQVNAALDGMECLLLDLFDKGLLRPDYTVPAGIPWTCDDLNRAVESVILTLAEKFA